MIKSVETFSKAYLVTFDNVFSICKTDQSISLEAD